MKKYTGLIAAIAASVIFALASVLGRLTFDLGSNSVMITFLRCTLAVPVLFLLLKFLNIPLRVSRRELLDLAVVALLGYAPSSLLLFSAFNFIAVGPATVLHFLFPTFVTLINAFIYKMRINRLTLAALFLATLGTFFFFDDSSQLALTGVLLALTSAVTYTIYSLGVEHTRLKSMAPLKVSFYLSAIGAIEVGLFAYLGGYMTFALTPMAWVYTFLVAITVTVIGFTLLQWGIGEIGATTASIVSTAEPVTGILLGWVMLNETLDLQKGIASVAIIVSVILIILSEIRYNGTKAALRSEKRD